MLNYIASAFHGGGVFMYIILLVLAVGTAIIIERLLILRASAVDAQALWTAVSRHLDAGRINDALVACEGGKTSLHQVLHSGVAAMEQAKDREDIENAVEETMMDIMPRLESRLHYLPTLANVATLVGLLGTVAGLIRSFSSVSEADPTQKAAMISHGISLAMNATAFGLISAIPLMLGYSLLHSRTNAMIDTLDTYSFKLINLNASIHRKEGKT